MVPDKFSLSQQQLGPARKPGKGEGVGPLGIFVSVCFLPAAMSVKAEAISAVQQQDGLIMA
jgi:hypothetical protein